MKYHFHHIPPPTTSLLFNFPQKVIWHYQKSQLKRIVVYANCPLPESPFFVSQTSLPLKAPALSARTDLFFYINHFPLFLSKVSLNHHFHPQWPNSPSPLPNTMILLPSEKTESKRLVVGYIRLMS